MGRSGIIDAYRTGRGSDPHARRGRDRGGPAAATASSITELPYQVGPNAVLAKIKELVATKEIEGIADANDESARATTPASSSR